MVQSHSSKVGGWDHDDEVPIQRLYIKDGGIPTFIPSRFRLWGPYISYSFGHGHTRRDERISFRLSIGIHSTRLVSSRGSWQVSFLSVPLVLFQFLVVVVWRLVLVVPVVGRHMVELILSQKHGSNSVSSLSFLWAPRTGTPPGPVTQMALVRCGLVVVSSFSGCCCCCKT